MNGGSPYSYNLGALVLYEVAGVTQVWVSTASNNTTTPGAGGAHWSALAAPSSALFTGGTSTGAANAQAIATNQGDYVNTAGNIVTFLAGASISGAATLSVDTVSDIPLKVISPSGIRATQTGDIVAAGEYICISDGTNYRSSTPPISCKSPSPKAGSPMAARSRGHRTRS